MKLFLRYPLASSILSQANGASPLSQLRNKDLTLEGCYIAHSGPGAGALLIRIQELIRIPGDDEKVSRITLGNNILHDSYNNDIHRI